MDRPEPGEALYSNLVWSHYNGEKKVSLNEKDIEYFKNTGTFHETHHVTGKPGSFLTKIEKKLDPEEKLLVFVSPGSAISSLGINDAS